MIYLKKMIKKLNNCVEDKNKIKYKNLEARKIKDKDKNKKR